VLFICMDISFWDLTKPLADDPIHCVGRMNCFFGFIKIINVWVAHL